MAEDKDAPSEREAVVAWLLELRENAGLSQEQAAIATGYSPREIRRWEKESAPGSVALLKLLSAYGVQLTPPRPRELPGAVNEQLNRLSELVAETERRRRSESEDVLRNLREALAEMETERSEEEAGASPFEIARRLAALEAAVAGLARAEDVKLGFAALEAAIDRQARAHTDEDHPPQTGTDG